MKLREFEQLALEYWEEIPEDYKRGIDRVRVRREAKAHDELPDVYTMGECLTEAYPSDFGGPETIRSAVVLYHGSFAALADIDEDFDWEEELWETLTHELKHHLESLAGDDALEDVDYAADENFKRYEGESFDPAFYRAAEAVPAAQGAALRIGDAAPVPLAGWQVEGDWFFETTYARDAAPGGRASLEWSGARHAFDIPALEADVSFVVLGDGFDPGPVAGRRVEEVCVVLVRRASSWRSALDALRGRVPSVEQIEVEVESGEAS